MCIDTDSNSGKPVHFTNTFIIVYVHVKVKLRQFNPVKLTVAELTNFVNKQHTLWH